MKKFIFYLTIIVGILIAVYAWFVVEYLPEFNLLVYNLGALFLIVFGAYGLYAEKLWKKFHAQGKSENLCVEANYHIRKMGFFGRVFLFPFLKIKSSNSYVVSFLGATVWIIIISILLKALLG